jgi:hypothetical protein
MNSIKNNARARLQVDELHKLRGQFPELNRQVGRARE